MFEASGVGISREIGVDVSVSSWRGAEMFEAHENDGVERVDVRKTPILQSLLFGRTKS